MRMRHTRRWQVGMVRACLIATGLLGNTAAVGADEPMMPRGPAGESAALQPAAGEVLGRMNAASASEGRRAAAQRAWQEALGDERFVREAPAAELLELARVSAGGLAPQQRQQLSEQLLTRLADDDRMLVALPPATFLALRAALLELGVGPDHPRLVWLVRYVNQEEAWRTASAAELAEMIRIAPLITASRGPVYDAKAALLDEALGVRLTEERLRRPGAGEAKLDLLRLAGAAALKSPAGQRDVLRQRLEALASDAEWLTPLSAGELAELRLALTSARAEANAWADRVREWADARQDWEQAEAAELATALSVISGARIAAGEEVAAQLEASLLRAAQAAIGRAEAWRGDDSELLSLVPVAGRHLPPEGKAALMRAVQQRYLQAEAMGGLRVAELAPARTALLSLDASGAALVPLYQAWMAAHPRWEEARAAELVDLIAALDAQRLPPLRGLQEQALRALTQLQPMSKLSIQELTNLAPALLKVGANHGERDSASPPSGLVLARVTTAWMRARPRWQDESSLSLVALARALDPTHAPPLQPAQLSVLDALASRLPDGATKAEEARGMLALLPALAASLSDATRERFEAALARWATAHPNVVQQLSASQMLALLQSLRKEGVATPAQGTLLLTWAQAHVTLVEPPDGAYLGLLESLGDIGPEAKQKALGSKLGGGGDGSGADALPNLRVAFLITASISAADAAAWRRQLLGSLDAAGSPDARAAWLLALAYAQETLPIASGLGRPDAGLDRVDRRSPVAAALADAEAEPLRLLALDWLVSRHRQVQELDRAATLLASVAHQFTGEKSRSRIAQLQAELRAEKAREATHVAQLERDAEIARLEGQAEYLRDQLRRAKERGAHSEDIASLERIVTNTQDRLAEMVYGP